MSVNTPGEALQLAQRPPSGRFEVAKGALLRSVIGRFGLGLAVFLVLFCFVGPLVYRTDQVTTNINQVLCHPSGHHLLGCDPNGYDELGRLMLGGQSTIEIGLLAALLATAVGTVYGGIAGYFGGKIDAVMMRVVDVLLSVPTLVLLLLLIAIYGTSLKLFVLLLGGFAWLTPARLIRGESLTLRVRDYVLAARLMGAGHLRIVFRHLLPNALGTIVVNTTFSVADTVLAMATLGFLGFGLPPPATNWGTMINDGNDYGNLWWLLYPAGIMIIMTVLAFNFIGEGLEEALGARSRR